MIPSLLRKLCDDAALFPPGNAPLDLAVPQHFAHTRAAYAELVGPFVLPVSRLGELTTVLAPLEVSLTAPEGPGTVGPALDTAALMTNVRVVAVEMAIPEGANLEPLRGIDPSVDIYIEIPRGPRREATLDAVAQGGYRAKFRTGGVTADDYPDEAELADAIFQATERQVPFKATAGLHHAIRNSSQDNGFEQHGYLNLVLAAQAARAGATPKELVEILALRDAKVVAKEVAAIDAPRAFLSFGTCSIREPLDDLIALGLVRPHEGVNS